MKPIEETDTLYTENATLDVQVVDRPTVHVQDEHGYEFVLSDHLIRKNREKGVWSIHDKRGIE